MQPLGVREPNDFDEAFAAMNSQISPDAILMVADALTVLNRKTVFDYAAARHLPAIYEYSFLVRDGGLMSYGPDLKECLERVAVMVDRIFKGEQPRDLPFEEPTHYPFAINLKTAKDTGLTVPTQLLALADEVVSESADDCFWPIAAAPNARLRVRYWGLSCRAARCPARQLITQSGHWVVPYSITSSARVSTA